jgi:hypothetical protein
VNVAVIVIVSVQLTDADGFTVYVAGSGFVPW